MYDGFGIRKRLDLLKESLEGKWAKDSKKFVGSGCPFCFYTTTDTFILSPSDCRLCLCPPEICCPPNEDGIRVGSFIEYLWKENGLIMIKELPKRLLIKMRSLFKKAIKDCEEILKC